MRSICISFLTLVTLSVAAATTAHADPYPWCAQYSGSWGGGARNCGFSTYAQCMATVSGVGGFCERNQFYTGPKQRSRGRYED